MTDKSVRSIERAFDLLFALSDHELGLSELCGSTGLSKATTHRILATLGGMGLVELDPASERYSLGLRFVELRNAAIGQLPMRQVSLPIMAELQRLSGETVGLHLLRGSYRICVEELEAAHPIRHTTAIGVPRPLHAGAGKAILAFLPDAEIQQLIQLGVERFTAHTITEPERLLAEVRQIRQRGYATSIEEHGTGACSISAPIFGRDSQVQAALSISGPLFRFGPAHFDTYAGPLREGARRISTSLGHQSRPVEQTAL